VVIDRNTFTDIGYHGLLTLGNTNTENMTITNNFIDGAGITRYWSTSGIFAQGSMNVLIANNEITRTSGNGMNVIGEALGKDYWSEGTTNDFVIDVEYNYVHDFGIGITNDFGAIKTGSKSKNCDSADEAGLEESCFTYIRVYNNLLRDGWPYYCCANVLYSDVSSSKTTFENNLLYGSGSGGITHHCGLENESKNNYIHRVASPANGHDPITNLWGACEANKGKHQSFSNHHNIYFFDNTEDLTLYKPFNWFDERTVFSDNLFFSLNPEDEFKPMFPPDNLQFSDLPSVGYDRNKWTDPKFLDAEARDYQLAEDSPAHDMGIQQIRLDNFGVQNQRGTHS